MTSPSDARHVSRFRVRYAETDQMGVVYHTHYLVWCEVGRTDYIRERGVSYAELERRGLFLAVAEAHVRYLAAARYDDMIRVETRLERVQSRVLTFEYELWREPEEGREELRLATATVRLVALDRAGRPRALPAEVLELFSNTSHAS